MLLRHYLEQGMSKRARARKFGISLEALYRWIREGDLDRDLDAHPVRPRPPVGTKLNPYEPLIQVRLEAFPELSSVRRSEKMRAAVRRGLWR